MDNQEPTTTPETPVEQTPQYTCTTCNDHGIVKKKAVNEAGEELGHYIDVPCPSHTEKPQVLQSKCVNCIGNNPNMNVTPENHCAVCNRDLNVPQAQPLTNEQKEDAPLEGEVVEKHAGGRPTKYSEEILLKANQYFDECLYGKKDDNGKLIRAPRTPLMEELELELDISDDTIINWAKDPEKKEFLATYNKIKKLYRMRLKQILIKGKSNPLGPKFLLEVDHGLISSEKKILTGEAQAPLQIEITEEPGKKQLLDQATS